MPGSDSDPEQDEENGDFFVSKGKSKKLPDLMRTCKTKKCGCGKGNFLHQNAGTGIQGCLYLAPVLVFGV